MALKRKTRNLPNLNDADKRNQVGRSARVSFLVDFRLSTKMSFFDPVYQNDNDDDFTARGSARRDFGERNQDESNETLNADSAGYGAVATEDDDGADGENSMEV